MTKDELIAHLENILGSVKHLLEGANSIPDLGGILLAIEHYVGDPSTGTPPSDGSLT